MNKQSHRSITMESLITDPKPRARLTALYDADKHLIEMRMAKGTGHRTVTMSVGAFRYMVASVEELIQNRGERPI